MDLVSVVIPAFNHEKYVVEAIEGIVNQSYPEIELLVIDDGSRDNTYNVLLGLTAKYKKRFKRFQVWTRKNKGTAATLNELLSLAQGRYVFTQASDDVALPNAISSLVELLEKNPSAVLAVGDNQLINGESKRIYWKKGYVPTVNLEEADFITFGDALGLNKESKVKFGDYLTLLNANHVPNGYLVRKLVYDEIGGYDASKGIEDWYMNLQLAKRGSFIYSRDVLFSYRFHGSNTVSSGSYNNKFSMNLKAIYLGELPYVVRRGKLISWTKLFFKNYVLPYRLNRKK